MTQGKRPVRILNAEVARKIAAGEVIDRPAAIVRELIDNAIDSGATKISVEVKGGGIESVRVVDNGQGMSKEDLANCARPHATSKIETEEDLLNLTTLGFRGEALSSIAAVCRLSIKSGEWNMRASVTEDHIVERTTPVEGCIVHAEGLFENFPARRRFLKRPASEMFLCKNIFIEKTLPRPDIAFAFTSEGERKLTLEATEMLTHRVVQAAFPNENESLFYEISGTAGGKNPDWSFTCVIGEPGISRPNRKDISIFVNGRKINEYSLVQAIEYGGQGFFPNGTFPVACLFVTMNPALVDFNIHPAKREARFRDIASLHHGVSVAVRNFFHDYTVRTMKGGLEERAPLRPAEDFSRIVMHRGSNEFVSPFAKKADTKNAAPYKIKHDAKNAALSLARRALEDDESYQEEAQDGREKIIDIIKKQQDAIISQSGEKSIDVIKKYYSDKNFTNDDVAVSRNAIAISRKINHQNGKHRQNDADYQNAELLSSPHETPQNDFHFLGSALGTFLVAEKGNALYIIDKHAAHERILYDEIMANQGKSQALLVPYTIETQSPSDDIYLSSLQGMLKEAGLIIASKGDGVWEISAVPERWQGSAQDLQNLLLDERIAPNEVIAKTAALTACKAAVKDGWILDDNAAATLAENALALPDPHCPHGRPVWHKLTREELFALVKRT